jgi:hypothetical protein
MEATSMNKPSMATILSGSAPIGLLPLLFDPIYIMVKGLIHAFASWFLESMLLELIS